MPTLPTPPAFNPIAGHAYQYNDNAWQDVTPVGSILPQYYGNVQSGLRGELPQDVVDMLKRRSAEFGVASGLPGSEFAGYAGLRQLGLTSLDRMKQAEQLALPTIQMQANVRNQLWNQRMQQENIYEQQRQAAAALNERARREYLATSGGGTPPIVNPPGTLPQSPMQAPMSRTPTSTNAQGVVSNILSKYGGGGGGPLSMYEAPAGSYSEGDWTNPAPDFFNQFETSSMVPEFSNAQAPLSQEDWTNPQYTFEE